MSSSNDRPGDKQPHQQPPGVNVFVNQGQGQQYAQGQGEQHNLTGDFSGSVVNLKASLEQVSQSITTLPAQSARLKSAFQAFVADLEPRLSALEKADTKHAQALLGTLQRLIELLHGQRDPTALHADVEQLAAELTPDDALPAAVNAAVGNLLDKVRASVWADDPNRIAFANREELLRELKLKDVVVQYVLIDEPFGYGKTRLLEKVQQELRAEKNLCALLRFDRQRFSSVEAVVDALRLQLDGRSAHEAQEDPQDSHSTALLIDAIGAQLHAGKMVMLIFDGLEHLLDANQDPNLFAEIAGLPLQIVDNLYSRPSLHNFKAVFAGRNIRLHLQRLVDSAGARLVVRQLRPFDDKAIEYATRATLQYLNIKHIPDEEIRELSRRILRYTGGHPKCIDQVLTDLGRQRFGAWRGYLTPQRQGIIYSTTIAPIVGEVIKQVPEHLRPVLELLSPFRCFDWNTIVYLAEQGKLPGGTVLSRENAWQMVNQLAETWLCEVPPREAGFRTTDIVRRLLAINLCHDRGTSYYLELCKLAEEHYRTMLGVTTKNSVAERYLIELTFQQLQGFLLAVSGQPPRRQVRDAIADTFRQYLAGMGSAERRGRLAELREAVKDDWEWNTLLVELLGSGGWRDLFDELELAP